MEQAKCPHCKSAEGFDIFPAFQSQSENMVSMAELFVQCKSCKKLYPVLNIKQLTDKVDQTFVLLQEVREKIK